MWLPLLGNEVLIVVAVNVLECIELRLGSTLKKVVSNRLADLCSSVLLFILQYIKSPQSKPI